jgi:hypothetical protein
MRLWRDEKTAGIPMEAVTRARDMRARVHDFDWDATCLGPRLLLVLLTSGYAKALAGRHGVPILRKPYQAAALAEMVRSTLHSRAAGDPNQGRLL